MASGGLWVGDCPEWSRWLWTLCPLWKATSKIEDGLVDRLNDGAEGRENIRTVGIKSRQRGCIFYAILDKFHQEWCGYGTRSWQIFAPWMRSSYIMDVCHLSSGCSRGWRPAGMKLMITLVFHLQPRSEVATFQRLLSRRGLESRSACGENDGIYGSGDTPSISSRASPRKSGYVWYRADESVGGRMTVAANVNFWGAAPP